MIPIDSIANLALSINEVCALDSTRLSDPEAFRRFAAGIRLSQDFLANERWAQVQLPPTLSGPYDLVMHEMLPTIYDAAWLESQGGQFAIRITGIGDYTVAAINRRVVVLRGLPTDLETGAEVIDIEIAPDIFMSFARGLLLDIAEDILEEDDEDEDREVSNAELLLHGMPAGGGLGVPNLPSVEGSLVKLPSNLDFQYENYHYGYGDNIKKFALDERSGWHSNDAEGVTVGFEEDFGRPLEQAGRYRWSSGNSLLELSPGDGSTGHLYADIIAPRGSVIPFSFDLSARAGNGYSSRVKVLWGGSEVAEPNPGNSTFELKTYNIDLAASGGSDRIEFKASDPDKAGITLDNIKFNVPGDFNVPLVDSIDSKIGTVDGNGIGRGYLARYDAGDTFAVNLQAGVEYEIDIRGFAYGDKSELLNPAVGGIKDSTFNQVADDLITKSDDGKQVLFRPTKSGRYYIEAFTSKSKPFNELYNGPYDIADESGAYELQVTEKNVLYHSEYLREIDFSGLISSAGESETLPVGRIGKEGKAEGWISSDDDGDTFAVNLQAGIKYKVKLQGVQHGEHKALANPLVEIRDSKGNHMGPGADGGEYGGDGETEVTFMPRYSGSYYISVFTTKYHSDDNLHIRKPQEGEDGAYELSFTQIEANYHSEFLRGIDFDSSIEALKDNSIGVIRDTKGYGRIDQGDDGDWFSAYLHGGVTYKIQLRGASPDGSQDDILKDPFIGGVYDGRGQFINGSASVEKGDGETEVLFTPEASDFYYINAFGGTPGKYELTVDEKCITFKKLIEPSPTDGRASFETPIGANSPDQDVRLDKGGGSVSWSAIKGPENATSPLSFDIADPSSDPNGKLEVWWRGEKIDEVSTSAKGHYEYDLYRSGDSDDSLKLLNNSQSDVVLTNIWKNRLTADFGPDVVDSTGARISQAGTIGRDGIAHGQISYGDEDWIIVPLSKGRSYDFDMVGVKDNPLATPLIKGIYDENQKKLDIPDENDLDGHVTFTPEGDGVGTYFIALASSSSEGVGEYELRVDLAAKASDLTEAPPSAPSTPAWCGGNASLCFANSTSPVAFSAIGIGVGACGNAASALPFACLAASNFCSAKATASIVACGTNGGLCYANASASISMCGADAGACGLNAGLGFLMCGAAASACGVKGYLLTSMCGGAATACGAALAVIPCVAKATVCGSDLSGGLTAGVCGFNLVGDVVSACLVNILPALPSC